MDTINLEEKFKTPNDFSLHIEEKVNKGELSYMEAIIEYCEDADFDIESVKPLINTSLREKIRNEAIEKNLLRKMGRLAL